MLPHAHPFRFVERVAGAGEPVLAWTVDGSFGRGGELPPMLMVEMMAQAALLALPAVASASAGGAPSPLARGLLAGLDGVRFLAPVRPGDALRARAELVGRFGRLVKARVTLLRVGDDAARPESVAEGDLLLALEEGEAR